MRKRSALSIFVAVFSVFIVFPTLIFAGNVYENRNVEFKDGNAQPARFGQVIFEDSLQSMNNWDSEVWNYENRLQLSFERDYKGKKCFFADGEGVPECDTAWSIRTYRQPLGELPKLADGELNEYVIALIFSTNLKFQGEHNGDRWGSRIVWYDAKNQECGAEPILFCADSGDFQEVNLYGKIPAEARSFVIQIAFDRPNFDRGRFFALHSVQFGVVDKEKPFWKTGSFISEIMPGNGEVSWDAEIPENTSVRFQYASAIMEDGIPVDFTDFIGPDGTSETFFEKPFMVKGEYVRYKAFLEPNGKTVPILKNVTVGKNIDSDWSLRNYTLPPRVQIVSPSPTLNKRENLVVRISSPILILWNQLKITLDEEDFTSQFTRDGEFLTYVPKSDWVDGLHTVDVTISDFRGNSVTANKFFYIGESPKTEKITLRDDGCVLIEGKPFFPIGIYSVMKREFNDYDLDKAFIGLKEAGFNFAHSYNLPRTDEFLEVAHKHGFKLWSVARLPDERFINIERHHPAILAWYLGDDTSANTTPSELFDRNDAMKALDPTRITTQADPVGSDNVITNYHDYVTGTDSFLPEIYPVYKKGEDSGRDCVARTILDMKRCHQDIASANDGPKSLWPIIQYFQGWGWERFPTYEELRAMSFASLIYGANGITWYTYGGTVEPEKKKFNYGVTTTPERWENMSKVAMQIRNISHILLERTPKEQVVATILDGPKNDTLGNNSISCLLKTYGDEVWLLTVNSSTETIHAEFEIPVIYGISSGSVTVSDENRSVTIQNGRFTDEFKGFDVHVYRLK